jgi:hypothetical protein
MLTGSCLCAGVRYEITGKIGPVVFCHCSQCRKANGSAFAANAPVRTRYFRITSGQELIAEYESTPGKFRAFCRVCGSPIYSRRPEVPDIVRIRLGSLDADPGRRPLAHIWVSSKAPWYEITDGILEVAEETPPESQTT